MKYSSMLQTFDSDPVIGIYLCSLTWSWDITEIIKAHFQANGRESQLQFVFCRFLVSLLRVPAVPVTTPCPVRWET